MNRIVSLLFLMLGVVSFAQDKNVLLVRLADGSKVEFLLDESPCVTFEKGTVIVKSSMVKGEFKRNEILRFEYIGVENTSVEQSSYKTTLPECFGNTLVVTGLTENTKVQVHSSNGQIVNELVADALGKVVVSLEKYPSGLYIISYSNVTYKFTKL